MNADITSPEITNQIDWFEMNAFICSLSDK